uniref:WD_REPEATS_REGION domain-containing protein n=1 Tax=Loa loa TaxID=7209 RepID=A0A1I7W3X1_LOALO
MYMLAMIFKEKHLKYAEFAGKVLNEMELKKRNHEVSIFQLLKLPINPVNVIGSSVESSSRTLAITADVKPGNEWFATGGADRIVKIWDLASGKLRLSLTGHVSAVRCCKVSRRHSFLFTGGEDKQQLCLICQEKQQEYDDGNEGNGIRIDALLEYDKTMGVDNLDEIENEISLINSTAWLQNPSDPKDWKDKVAKFQELYQTFEFDEANNQLQALKIKGNAFAMEKNANKQNALKKWHRLPIIRLRIHKIEENILNGDNFGDSIDALQRIDNVRDSATEVNY